MSDIISKIPSSMLVNDTADAAQVNKALLNQVQGSNKIIDAVNTVNAAVNTVNAAVTAVGSGIVELGTNSNGTYVKWGNGLMKVFVKSSSITVNAAVGSLYYGTVGTISYPATFVSVIGITSNAIRATGSNLIWGSVIGYGLTGCGNFIALSDGNGSTAYITAEITGMWK